MVELTAQNAPLVMWQEIERFDNEDFSDSILFGTIGGTWCPRVAIMWLTFVLRLELVKFSQLLVQKNYLSPPLFKIMVYCGDYN